MDIAGKLEVHTVCICRHAFRTDFACKINFKSNFCESVDFQKNDLKAYSGNDREQDLCANEGKQLRMYQETLFFACFI